MTERAGRTRPWRFKQIALGKPWCRALILPDGRRLILRPIQPFDAPALREGFSRLTSDEVRFRFLHPMRELTPDYARQLTCLNNAEEFALVLVEAKPPEEARICAVGRVAINPSGSDAEFAVIVARELRGQGLGRFLVTRLAEWARKKGLQALTGTVLEENRPMLGLMTSMGFQTRAHRNEAGLVRGRLKLNGYNKPT